MNGLQIIDLRETTFMDRLLRREPRENAFLEINNLLASVPILKLDKASIDNCLKRYNISPEKARSRLMHFYSIILKHFVSDFNITDTEFEKLRHLQHILSIKTDQIGSLHAAILYPIYQNYVRHAVSDGVLSKPEREHLQKLSGQLRIPAEFARRIYQNEANQYLHSRLRQTLSDGMLSTAEETELLKIAAALDVELTLDASAKKNLQRHRYLWQLHAGNLPVIETGLYLQKGEFCAAGVEAEYYVIGNIREPLKISGFEQELQRSDYGFHAGMIRTNRLPGEVMRFDSRGALYFTNLRLLFNHVRGTLEFPLHELIGATFYQNGLLIEQKVGRDKFFKFGGDLEAIKIIFNSLMTRVRRH